MRSQRSNKRTPIRSLIFVFLLALIVTSCKPGGRKATEKADVPNEASPGVQGEPGAKLFGGRMVFERLLGRTKEDEQLGGLAADKEGNVYVSGNHETANDAIIVARINADGALRWAKTYAATKGDKRNAHVIEVMEGTVYVAGRTAELSTSSAPKWMVAWWRSRGQRSPKAARSLAACFLMKAFMTGLLPRKDEPRSQPRREVATGSVLARLTDTSAQQHGSRGVPLAGSGAEPRMGCGRRLR